ncbi:MULTISPECIES: hypothetical protein [Rhizobium]|uniref:hypothetical protein n=1 Tax=Rhizobium TaxID=379 RepID=UPI0010316FE3|nr:MULTISPECIES: hypothetical protein [Rhizobium]MBA1343950.1 hypothetical protein [Rhizobium sp. WYCCWR 11146]TBF89203.1 hypothetical protein ELG82_37290 [Rhizobium leguminosarum]
MGLIIDKPYEPTICRASPYDVCIAVENSNQFACRHRAQRKFMERHRWHFGVILGVTLFEFRTLLKRSITAGLLGFRKEQQFVLAGNDLIGPNYYFHPKYPFVNHRATYSCDTAGAKL